MRPWLYQLLMRIAAWAQPAAMPEPITSARPQVYAKGLWDRDPHIATTFTVEELLQEIVWETTPSPLQSSAKDFFVP
jgi:hypothetical protein